MVMAIEEHIVLLATKPMISAASSGHIPMTHPDILHIIYVNYLAIGFAPFDVFKCGRFIKSLQNEQTSSLSSNIGTVC